MWRTKHRPFSSISETQQEAGVGVARVVRVSWCLLLKCSLVQNASRVLHSSCIPTWHGLGFPQLVQVGQAKAQFLTECAKAMDGAPFYLQALSFDPSKNENPRHFRKVINSVEEGRQLFKAVSEDAGPPVVKAKKHGSKKSIAVLEGQVQKQVQCIEKLRGVVDSTLNENEKLQSMSRHLQEMLNATKMAAKQFEVSVQCCVCNSSKVSVAFLPCQHACCCRQCWGNFVNKSNGSATCPLCKQPTLGQMGMHLP